MNRWCALALLLALAGALALRVTHLGDRPLHGDEAVNAFKLTALSDRGEYKYDPHEFHGPTLYHAARLVTPAGRADADLRVVSAMFGIGTLLLLLLLRDAMGQGGAVCAMVFLAVSPVMVFYNRYFIHETPLVFFTLLTLVTGWRYCVSRKLPWAVLCGAGVGLMFATKETFVFSVSAMLLALIGCRVLERFNRKHDVTAKAAPRSSTQHLFKPALLLGTTAAVVIWFVAFSSFFTNWPGLADSVKTYSIWLERAGGASPHNQPWSFYLERLLWFKQARGPLWTECAIALLAVIGAVMAFSGNRAAVAQPVFARFVTFYTVILAATYSCISYKTPWCAMSFWLGAILLAGIGAAGLLRCCVKPVWRGALAVLLAMVVAHLAYQSWRAVTTLAASPKNPWVYAHTSFVVHELVERVKAIAQVSPDADATRVDIVSPESYWPLPWYLRELRNAGWWEAMPPKAEAPIVVVSTSLSPKLDETSGHRYIMTGIYELRPNVFMELYVERGLWERVVPTLPRATD